MAVTSRRWRGIWIKGMGAAPLLRKRFELKRVPDSVTAFVCGLGFHVLYINGHKADERELAPGISQYDRHVSYIRYDITGLLQEGYNSIAVLLGDGLYHDPARNAWAFQHASWRDDCKLLCELESDGKVIVVSDLTWKYAASWITNTGLRLGEEQDCRNFNVRSLGNDFDDGAWTSVSQAAPPPGRLMEENMPPVKVIRRISAVSSHPIGQNGIIYDFGVNLAGRCELKVRGAAGCRLTVTYGERLYADGRLDLENISQHVSEKTFQTESFYLDGSEQRLHSNFTYSGFQYAEIVWENGKPEILTAEAVFLATDLKEVGNLDSSDEILNRLQAAAKRSYRGNFVGIPTDCPHREKNGWTGDAQLAFETGCWNFDMEEAASNFLRIVVDTQRASGQLPGIAPTGGWGFNWGSGPAWDAILFEYPLQMYRFYGNTENLVEHFAAYRRYLEFCRGMSVADLLDFGLGDWCSGIAENPPTRLTSSAYYSHMVVTMAAFCRILGHDASEYDELAARIKAAFNRAFYRGGGIYHQGEITSLSCALYLGLVPESERGAVAARLADKVRAENHLAKFGILGAKYVLRVLADYGYIDDAWQILTQTTCPGWANWVKNGGATTLWEHWDGTSSRNHIMFGDFSGWCYEYLGGIKYHHPLGTLAIHPQLPRHLKFFSAAYQSRDGKIVSGWKREQDGVEFNITIPDGRTAEFVWNGHASTLHAGENKLVFRE